ncbi:bacterio-opsin activator domain-containing protein, partial [Halodesulfurarchaeum sp.]|uniref:bacterio-opsin activator domain-containing protein n=1 Tax=Halodesulfurarchaeum sp. TaxID=1980530 RepID=UPI002FC3DC27
MGLGYSIYLLYRVKDARFGFLTLMLGLMATRQILSYQAGTPGIDELPGLLVSVLAVLTVYYLSEYVEQETKIKNTIRSTNERLGTFEKAIEHAGHMIFITDPDGTITYANRAVESVTGYSRGEVMGRDPSLWKSNYHEESFYAAMWDTIKDGSIWEGQIVNERKSGEQVWVDMTIAPIVNEDGTVEKYVAVDTDVTDRLERKEQITQQKNRLQTLNRTNEVLRDINRELVEADSRDAMEAAIVEQFADSPQYAFACLSDQAVGTEVIRPRATAGLDENDLDELIGAINELEGKDPLRTAARTGTVHISSCEDPEADWCKPWLERGYKATAAIPLTYGDRQYGVLCIGTDKIGAFKDIETAVFAELGETIGYAINAVESKEALLTDSVTEIEFEVTESDYFPVELTADGGSMELTWMTPGPGETLVQHFTIRDIDSARIEDFVDERPELGTVNIITTDKRELHARFELQKSSLARPIGEYGGDLRHIEASDGRARLTVHLSPNANVRTVVEGLQTDYPSIELRARRETERPAPTTEEIRTAIQESLTDRQQEVLHTAYIAGFFDWPRENSGEEIAET